MASESEDEAIDFLVDEANFSETPDDDYSKLNLEELKELCRRRKLACCGRKQEIIARLEDFDEHGPVWDEVERDIHIPTFRKKSGPSISANENYTAADYFRLVFTPQLINLLVAETNRYADQKLSHPFTAESAKNRWEPTNTEEMTAFLGCLIYMGLCKLGDLRDYWSEDLGQERIFSVFSQHRFRDLFRYLHCNDNMTALPKDHPEHDKLHKIHPMMTILQESFKQHWVPHQQNSIDEGMIPFTGRSSFKQYMKDKPTKWGFKIWKLVDSVSSYLYAFDIYTGKKEERETGLGPHVVLQMADELQPGQPWMLFFDNFFSSVDLIEQLYMKGIFATATIRPNRKGLPIEVTNAKLQPGEMIWRMKDPQIVVSKWKDTKDVMTISSMCRAVPTENDLVKKSQKGTAQKIVRECPPSITAYRPNMGGVDTNDQMLSYDNLSRKTYRWWMPIFLDLFKQAVVNAWIIERSHKNAAARSQKDFRIELYKGLIGKFSARKRAFGQQPNAVQRYDGMQHFVIRVDKRGLCKNGCGKKVQYKCSKCDIFLCIDCYQIYHMPQSY